ncbi:MAG: T9SS type A sorting domain-containing protein, partial [Bacteroidales bacterium]|nr:T9SS type A sorting domain-containing protein [Bacteroidales bacterium]
EIGIDWDKEPYYNQDFDYNASTGKPTLVNRGIYTLDGLHLNEYGFKRMANLLSYTLTIPYDYAIANTDEIINKWEFNPSLNSIIIGKEISLIKTGAFYYCKNLKEISILTSLPPKIEDDLVFYNVDKSIPIRIPKGSIDAYKSAEYWDEFTNYIESDFTNIEDIDSNKKVNITYKSDKILMITNIGTPINVTIYNLSGIVIRNVIVTSDNNSIDLSNLPNGVYILSINGEKYKNLFCKIYLI